MIRFITLSFIAILITGWQSPSIDYAIVDNNPAISRGWHTTIQSALDSGATTIEIRDGEYPESVTLDRPLTILCRQGTTLLNDGQSVTFWITSPNVTIQGCTIQGNHDGFYPAGDFSTGTGINDVAGYTHIDGLRTINLRGFSYVNGTAGANNVIIENFSFENVGTDPNQAKCVATAILFIAANDGHVVRNGYITGYSQGVGFWYGVQDSTVSGTRFINNYGGHGTSCVDPRSAIEDYGLGRGNKNNKYLSNEVDGTRGAGFELADVVIDTVVSGNTIRNTGSGGGLGVVGSGDNRGQNVTIEGNTFYGDGDGLDQKNWFSGTGVIRNNYFIGWVDNNNGTILRPHDSVGYLDVVGNHFINNGRAIRINATGTRFNDNRIEGATYNDSIYIDSGDYRTEIDGNYFTGDNVALVTNITNGVRFTNNYVEGILHFSGGEGTVIQNNEIHIPSNHYTAFVTPQQSRVLDNHITGSIPYIVAGQYVLVEGNYITKSDGSPVAIPPCSADSTCRNNYTVGQVP